VRRRSIAVVFVVIVVPLAFVAYRAVATLSVLTQVERERDQWQRPTEVMALLDLRDGATVVDFGCGAGYFALKLSAIVGSSGTVLATDIRRESLAFLWIRAVLSHRRNLRVIHGEPDDPRLPPVALDGILIANTYHELPAPKQMVATLIRTLKSGGRLVVLDRKQRANSPSSDPAPRHEADPARAEQDLRDVGLEIVRRDERFIDRAGDDDIWWVVTAYKP
jgi:predicted methyltransferase